MSAQSQPEPEPDLTERLSDWLRRDYKTEVEALAQHYPNEQRSLEIDWRELHRSNPDVADDYLSEPDRMQQYLEEALRLFDLPIDVSLARAHARVYNLPDLHTYYPGEFSPTDHAGMYRAITGEISKATDVYSKIEEAAFECQVCGTLTRIPQSGRDFQEPHECQGCERQGPFQVNFDQSEFVDAQKLRVQTPPEVAAGAGQDVDVFVEDDLADVATVGDRVTVTGTVHLEQQTQGNSLSHKFEPYVEGHHIAVEETDHTDIEIASEERQRIRELADGAEGDPLEVAAESLAPKIYGYQHIKRALVLASVGGSRVVYPTGDADRGDFHVLLLGDPGTAKSKLGDRIADIAARSVSVDASDARKAGLTTAATRDDFGDGQWTIDAGAFVKANEGLLWLDELDDMSPDVRASMLAPMSKQTISVSKAGINATFSTRAAVIAAGNPLHGRFSEYEPIAEQFDLEPSLLSRFDLIYTVKDKPDPEEDREIARHMLSGRDAAKRAGQDLEIDEEDAERIVPTVEDDILRKWIALAKRQPDPVFESEAVREKLEDSFNSLRGIYDYNEDQPVPVTFRKLEGIVRVTEAAAKFEFSEVITERHARIATEAVGKSMRDFGQDEDGNFDADIQETGTSKSQKDRKQTLAKTIQRLQDESEQGHVGEETVVDELVTEHGYDRDRIYSDIQKMRMEDGVLIEPKQGYLKHIGRA
ncbi:minichromosome maintenance protein MCM [Saliphagus sp. LR7]|uniref:minichromosome maintenance protein MCM n=1 Tax=Saliphagus sp. LR7 TaxID=2282654 RepID=UPI000DF8162E|nr:minichromosome maintenance protein MCM [Saliphagus sp. LR7]